MTKEEIGEKLKAARISCGMTQQEVANAIGRKQPIVGHWETGYSQPDANTLFTLCDIYGTTIDELFGFIKKESFSKSESEHIKKYRSLDTHGKAHVDSVLDWETARMDELRQKDSRIGELEAGNAERVVPTRLISYYFRNASAGTGQLIIDNLPEKDIEIPDIPKYKNVSYAISVNGSSMNPTYQDGDILLVEATQEIEVGEIGIFQVDGECFVKKLGNTELISLNRSCANVPLNESARPMGRVIGKL